MTTGGLDTCTGSRQGRKGAEEGLTRRSGVFSRPLFLEFHIGWYKSQFLPLCIMQFTMGESSVSSVLCRAYFAWLCDR